MTPNVLSNAQVELNPHQIEAALFAFSNPLSRGAILADEVGLGKSIEAGLLISRQKDALLDKISRRLEQKTECSELFTVRWRLA